MVVAAVPNPKLVRAVDAFVKSDKLEDFANLVPTVVVNEVNASWSSDNDAESSPKVSKVEPAVPIISSILFCTNAVVAILVESFVDVCVGAVGLPVKAGELNIVAFDSFVTFPKPTSPLVVACALSDAKVPSASKVSPATKPASLVNELRVKSFVN